MIKATKGWNTFGEGMLFVIEVCWRGGVERPAMHVWFLRASETMRRSRLRGWRWWVQFLKARGFDAESMLTHPRPETLIANAIAWMDNPKVGVPDYQKKDLPPAVTSLFNIVGRKIGLTENQFVKTIRRNTNVVIKAAPKQMTIWPFTFFFIFYYLWFCSFHYTRLVCLLNFMIVVFD
jgi:hypothetical protein